MFTSMLVVISLAIGQAGPAPAPGFLSQMPATDKQMPVGFGQTQNVIPAAIPPVPGAAILAQPAPAVPKAEDKKDDGKKDNGNGKKDEEKKNGDGAIEVFSPAKTFFREYPALRVWFPNCLGKPDEPKKEEEKKPDDEKKNGNGNGNGEEKKAEEPPTRRGFDAPFMSPPFPSGEWQGAPVPGQPLGDPTPLTKALWAIQCDGIGDCLKENRIKMYGWVDASTNWSSNNNSNGPGGYWARANRLDLDQLVFRIEREVDMVQTDHFDWGFRSSVLFGEDYRGTIAGGWGSDQLLRRNNLYGWDPIEQYIDLYNPFIAQGALLRIGRYAALPDIEDPFGPDNYMMSHSLVYLADTATQTGVLLSVKLSDQWTVQVGVNAGDDMAPWYQGARVAGFLGLRWVSCDNKDSIYTCLNQINNAEYSHFTVDGQAAGHNNFNSLVSTWQHKFSDKCFTKTEGMLLWENNAAVGGSINLGPTEPWAAEGPVTPLPGRSLAYGLVNYTGYALSKDDAIVFRSEWWRDRRGLTTGFAGNYINVGLGLTHNFSSNLLIRPEIGFYHNCNQPAFDNGLRQNAVIAGCDLILKF